MNIEIKGTQKVLLVEDSENINLLTESNPVKLALAGTSVAGPPGPTGPQGPASTLTQEVLDLKAPLDYTNSVVAAEALERQKGDLAVLSSVSETGAGWGYRQNWHVNKLKVGGSNIANQVVSIDISNKAKSYPGNLFVTDNNIPQNPLLTTVEKQSGHLHLSDGGWCWFNDPRAICVKTPLGKNLIITSHVSYDGSVIVAQYDVDSGTSSSVNLASEFQQDDHDAPGLILMPSGKIRAYYSKHSSDNIIRWRESPTVEGISGTWTPPNSKSIDGFEVSTINGTIPPQNGGVCYPYPAYLSAEGRMYLFFRRRVVALTQSVQQTPSVEEWDHPRWFMTSDDLGTTWSTPKPLITNTSVRTPYLYKYVQRPYLQITDNGIDRIDLLFTDGHPGEYDANNPSGLEDGPGTSLYHAYIKNGNVYTSNGTQMVSLSTLGTTTGTYYAWGLDFKNQQNVSGLVPFTKIQDVAAKSSSSLGSSCWGWDLTRNNDTGEINVVFARFPRTTPVNDGRFGAVHEYWHGRYTPSAGQWVTNKITNDAGTWIPQDVLYSNGAVKEYASGQTHYSGGVTIDKDDPTIVYASVFLGTAAGYGTKGKDATFEIQRYTTINNGETWNFDSRLTGHGRRSQTKAVRPLTPRWKSRLTTTNVIPDVFWQEGRYHNYIVSESKGYEGYQCQVYSYPAPDSETPKVILKSQIPSMSSNYDFPGYVYLNTTSATIDTDPYPTTNILRKHLYGVKFDGTNYASTDAVDLSSATASLIMFCKFTINGSEQQHLVSNWTSAGGNVAGFLFRVNKLTANGRFEIWLNKPSNAGVQLCAFDPPSGVNLFNGSSYTTVFAYDITNGFRLWINGQPCTPITGLIPVGKTGNSTENSNPLSFGTLNSNKSYQPFYFGSSPHSSSSILNGALEQVTIWGSSSTPALTDAQILTLSNEPVTVIDTGETGGAAITPSKLAGAPVLSNGQGVYWDGSAWVGQSFVRTTDLSGALTSNSINMDKLSKGGASSDIFNNSYVGWDGAKFVPRSGASADLNPYDRSQGQAGLVVPSTPFVNGAGASLGMASGKIFYVRGFTSRAMTIKNLAVSVASVAGSPGQNAILEISLFDANLTTMYGWGSMTLSIGTQGYQQPSTMSWGSSGYTIAAGTAFYIAVGKVSGSATIGLWTADGTHETIWSAFCSTPGAVTNMQNEVGKFDAAATSGTTWTGSSPKAPTVSQIAAAGQTLNIPHTSYPLMFAKEY